MLTMSTRVEGTRSIPLNASSYSHRSVILRNWSHRVASESTSRACPSTMRIHTYVRYWNDLVIYPARRVLTSYKRSCFLSRSENDRESRARPLIGWRHLDTRARGINEKWKKKNEKTRSQIGTDLSGLRVMAWQKDLCNLMQSHAITRNRRVGRFLIYFAFSSDVRCIAIIIAWLLTVNWHGDYRSDIVLID